MLTLLLAVSTLTGSGGPIANELEVRRAVVHNRSGEELVRAERYAEAAPEFRQAILLDPLLAIAHFNLGQVSMALKEYPEAVRAFRGCEAAVERLGSLTSQERERRERENLDEIQELRESLAQLQAGRVSFVAPVPMIVRIEERIRFLENMRMKDRTVVRVPGEVYVGLGSAFFRQGRLVEAEKAYREAIKANARLGAAHNNLAVILMLTGRLEESRVALAAAEKAGFPVDARFKRDLAAARESGAPRERR